MKKLKFFFPFLFCAMVCVGQTRAIDSLRACLGKTQADTARINTLNVLSNHYISRSDYKTPDSLMKIAYQLSSKIGYKRGLIASLIIKGITQQYTNKYDSALVAYNKALSLAVTENFRLAMASCYTNIGIIYRTSGDPEKSLEYYFKALRVYELLGLKAGMASSYGNIANIHFGRADYAKALEMCKRSIDLREEAGDKKGLVISYNTMGLIYEYLNKFDEALKWYLKGLKFAEELNNRKGMGDLYCAVALNYLNQKKYDKALEYINKSITIRKELDTKLAIADSYDVLGNIYLKQGQISKAREVFMESLKLEEEMDSKSDAMDTYGSLALCDSATGNFKNAFLYIRKHMRLKDQIFNEENEEKMTELQTRFESEKKEQQIRLLNAEKISQEAINEADKKRRNVILLSVTAGLILVFIVAGVIFRSLRITRKQKSIIEQSHLQIEEQKELIEEKQKEILDSIKYASRIQKALLTSEKYLEKFLGNFFILYEPKDIVAGDFYWSTFQQNRFYLVVADCTGHGVPGAFMSLLNISILNEIIGERNILSPDKILNEARTSIIKALNPEGSHEESKDGMDCILVELDLQNLKLRYAAANNSFYIVRKGELITCKADKMPVGKSPNDSQQFSLYEVDLEKGDSIFMMTDGYADQFGGPKGKKFKYKPLEEKFVAIANLEMTQQKQELLSTFKNWKGSIEQVDDVCVMGIKI